MSKENGKCDFCLCGCGERVSKPKNRYIVGHQNKGKNNPMHGRHDHLSGLKLEWDRIKGMSWEERFGKKESDKRKKQMSRIHKGKKLSEELKEQKSEKMKGKKNHFYGKKHSRKTKEKIRDALKGIPLSEERRKKVSEGMARATLEGRNKPYPRNFQTGEFFSNKNEKYLHYRSSYELLAYQILEKMGKVLRYESEPIAIPYTDSENHKRNYIPDIWVLYDDGSEELIEVKARSFINSEGFKQQRKAAKEYCIKKDWNFSVWTKTRNSRLQKMVKIEVLN